MKERVKIKQQYYKTHLSAVIWTRLDVNQALLVHLFLIKSDFMQKLTTLCYCAFYVAHVVMRPVMTMIALAILVMAVMLKYLVINIYAEISYWERFRTIL